jgi:hypothetical protein
MIDDLFLPGNTVGAMVAEGVTVLAFDGPVRHLLLCNAGAYPVFYKLGLDGSVTVSVTSGDCILPGTKELFSGNGATHIALIAEGGSSRFVATSGFGEV